MNPDSPDPESVARPPATLLASAILIIVSVCLGAAEWWSDRKGFDSTIASMFQAEALYPMDGPVGPDGLQIVTSERSRRWKEADAAGNRHHRINTARKTVSITLIAVLFVSAFVCSCIAWRRMKGRSWSRPAAALMSICLNSLAAVCFAAAIPLSIATMGTESSAGIILVQFLIFGIWIWITIRYFGFTYTVLRPPPDAGPGVPLPSSWLPLIAAVFVVSVVVPGGTFFWLAGKKQEQKEIHAALQLENAAYAKTHAEEAWNSGKAKFHSKEEWERDRFFRGAGSGLDLPPEFERARTELLRDFESRTRNR